jgi:hypothetical protein
LIPHIPVSKIDEIINRRYFYLICTDLHTVRLRRYNDLAETSINIDIIDSLIL